MLRIDTERRPVPLVNESVTVLQGPAEPGYSNDAFRSGLLMLGRAREVLAAHRVAALAVGGFLAGWLIVVAGGRVGTVKSVIPLTSWLGLLSRNGYGSHDVLPGSLMLAGIAALLILWLLVMRARTYAQLTETRVWLIGVAWMTPFVVGPPLLSNDVFSYAAQGLLLRNGLDPYVVGPSALGNTPAVAAVDPAWRSAPSPYGPLASTMQHLAIAISGGSPLGAAIVFRVVGLVCLVAIGLLCAELAGPRRVQALTLTVLNPLLLLHVLSGAHLDGVMCALLLGALLAAHQRHWAIALLLAAAAGSIKAPAYLAVLVIIAVHQSYRFSWRLLARDAAISAGCVAGFTLLVPDGLGWLHALNTPGQAHTAFAPASIVGDIFSPIVSSASFDDLAAGGRISAMIAAGCIALYLTVTAYRRPLDRSVGLGMLAVGALSPVVYAWYLLGGIVCLAPTLRGLRRDWLVLLVAVACLVSPPGFSTRVSSLLSIAAIAVCLAVIAPRVLAARHDRAGRAGAGRVPADVSG